MSNCTMSAMQIISIVYFYHTQTVQHSAALLMKFEKCKEILIYKLLELKKNIFKNKNKPNHLQYCVLYYCFLLHKKFISHYKTSNTKRENKYSSQNFLSKQSVVYKLGITNNLNRINHELYSNLGFKKRRKIRFY